MKFARKSPLTNVSDEAWGKFVRALSTQALGAVSASAGVGMFAFPTRRLVEIGIMKDPKFFRAPSKRVVCTAKFVPPLTDAIFLSNPEVQYRALVVSTMDYVKRIVSGEIQKPEDMSLAGALALLHRGGRGALQFGELFSDTRALVQRAQEAF